jgi:anti-sigma B factor antagonist
MSIKFKHHARNQVPTIKISGSVSGKDALVLSNELRSASESQGARIVVDLSETSTLDSSAMGVIIYWWKNLKQQDRQLVLFNPHAAVMDLLVTTNLDKLINVTDSVE